MTPTQRALLADTLTRQIGQIDAGWPVNLPRRSPVRVLTPCERCGGSGERRVGRFGLAYRYRCGACRGTGRL